MRSSRPPALASTLLERLVVGPNRDVLVGDLIEQYTQGRSVAWYWRQVVMAIVVSVAKDVRDHKLLAVRSVAIGWLLYVLLSFPVNWLSASLRVSINNWLIETGRYSFWWLFLIGQLPSVLFVYLACAASGWIVARFDRAHQTAMVCVFGASVLLFEYGFIPLMFARHGHPSMPQAALVLPALLTIGRPVSILVGGLSVGGGSSKGRIA